MMHRVRGFTLIEVMMAVFLLSIIALGLTSTLVSTQRARAANERWMVATELAAQGMEQVRAGHSLGAVPVAGFERSGTIAVWNAHPGLYRVDVTVTWDDGTPHHLALSTLMRR